MRQIVVTLAVCLLSVWAQAEVVVFVEQGEGVALIKYQCTAGEVVRAFALDVSVDRGSILGISDFFVGESTAVTQGYGIFPASFRDHITIDQGGNINWNTSDYTPLAVTADDPGETKPGLGSSGVTLEFAALWDPAVPAAIPTMEGILCALQISQGANVTVTANEARGGVVAEDPDMILAPVFSGSFVQPPEVTGLSLINGVLTITFAGGELETAPTINGPWTGTGNTGGLYTGSVNGGNNRFYRVRHP